MIGKLSKVVREVTRMIPRMVGKEPHTKVFPDFVERIKMLPNARVLEIGARNVTGNPMRHKFAGTEYVGIDIHPGENVDIVGDAHKLSQLFPADHFDGIVSVAVFEHLFFPWKVAMEMNAVLKTGGIAFVATHPAWPSHELPWDFFRFQENGIHSLFNKATGFRVVQVHEGIPARLVPLAIDRNLLGLPLGSVNLGVHTLVEKIGPVDKRLRWDVPYEEVTDTMYPRP